MHVLQILVACLKVLRKIPSSSGDKKILYLGGWGNKGRFKVLYFTNTNVLFTLPPSPYHGSCDKAFESKVAK